MEGILRGLFRALKFLRSRAFAAGVLSLVLGMTIYKVSGLTHAVYIRDGEDLTLAYTMREDIGDVLKSEGITVMASDLVHFSGFGQSLAEVEIQRAVPITLTVGGRSKTVQVQGETVRELLAREGITLDGNDRINMDLEDTLFEGDHLKIERIDYVTRTEEIPIPYKTVATKTSLIGVGSRRVMTYGKEGTEVATYSRKLVDGQVVFEELISQRVMEEPTTERILLGAKEPISPLDFGYEFDEEGVPLGYQRVLTNQKATGYSARAGAKTASGRYAVTGHVAVDPGEIPYGTKMYIVSPDNSFIYGYAVAADTGTGLIAGHSDVDLFYDTYMESVLNSVRYVNIYILE